MTELNKPALAGHLLDALYFSVRDGKKIDNIPGLIEQLLAEDIWKEVYVEDTERVVTYERFEDFVTTPPPEGLGTKIETLKRLLGDNNAALNLLEAALQGKPGEPLKRDEEGKFFAVYDLHNGRKPSGTSRQAGIRRLRKERRDLLQRVLDREMTVHEAMVEAGFRKKQITALAEVESVVKKLKSTFSQEELNRIAELLREEGNNE